MTLFTKSDKAEIPVMAGFVVLISLMVLALAGFIGGTLTDAFVNSLTLLNMDLQPWTSGVLSKYVHDMALAEFVAPVVLGIAIIAWSIRQVFIRQQSIRTDTGLASNEEY